jgi:PAS domain-containing protein
MTHDPMTGPMNALPTKEDELFRCREKINRMKDWEKRLTLIIESTSIPVVAIDENHRITHCNKAYEKLLGIRDVPMMGT